MTDQSNLFLEFAAAYIRGVDPDARGAGDAALVEAGRARGHKLYPFKRTQGLPRIRAALGVLQGIQPDSVLDIGTGRGVFLWPLLDTFPDIPVTAVDRSDKRVSVLDAVTRGGVSRLTARTMDATALDVDDNSFDIVTILEVLEHLESPLLAAREAVRAARRFVVASVPSKEDDNPEHIQLFDGAGLVTLFEKAGARSVNVSYVLNHIICVAAVAEAM